MCNRERSPPSSTYMEWPVWAAERKGTVSILNTLRSHRAEILSIYMKSSGRFRFSLGEVWSCDYNGNYAVIPGGFGRIKLSQLCYFLFLCILSKASNPFFLQPSNLTGKASIGSASERLYHINQIRQRPFRVSFSQVGIIPPRHRNLYRFVVDVS